METFDLIVIGAGPGGYPAAIRAAQLGAKTAIVEREATGGTCLNWGCIPTKTLLAGATLFGQIQRAGEFGITVKSAAVDYAAMVGRKDRVVEKLRQGVEGLLKSNSIKSFAGTASFESRNQLTVLGADGKAARLEAKNIIIATGSASVLPGFLPVHARVVDSRAFLDRTELPVSLIVLGGGVIGCELACLAAQLGVKVTMVELLPEILTMLDDDVRKEARTAMEAMGIRILCGHPLAGIKATDREVTGEVDGATLRAGLLLAAIGRRPVTAGLQLEKAGVRTGKAGYIEVDAFGQTAAAGIYAVGDVNGGPQLAHAATAQALVAVENALLKTRRAFDSLVPSCIFTTPEIGTAGLTEQQARDAQRAVRTGKFSFAALGKALAAGEPHGFVKWIADADTGRLLGAAAVGPHATELIAEAALAIRSELTVREVARTVHAHPTLSESWMEAAHAVHGECIHAPAKRR
jgi:dihydrolipoamide dehydrogenase